MAEEKFKELAGAYAILSDFEKRRKYDEASKINQRPAPRPPEYKDRNFSEGTSRVRRDYSNIDKTVEEIGRRSREAAERVAKQSREAADRISKRSQKAVDEMFRRTDKIFKKKY